MSDISIAKTKWHTSLDDIRTFFPHPEKNKPYPGDNKMMFVKFATIEHNAKHHSTHVVHDKICPAKLLFGNNGYQDYIEWKVNDFDYMGDTLSIAIFMDRIENKNILGFNAFRENGMYEPDDAVVTFQIIKAFAIVDIASPEPEYDIAIEFAHRKDLTNAIPIAKNRKEAMNIIDSLKLCMKDSIFDIGASKISIKKKEPKP